MNEAYDGCKADLDRDGNKKVGGGKHGLYCIKSTVGRETEEGDEGFQRG